MTKLYEREPYQITRRRINKVKGYEVSYIAEGESGLRNPLKLGWFKSLRKAKNVIFLNKNYNEIAKRLGKV